MHTNLIAGDVSIACVCSSSATMNEEALSALCTPALVVDVDKVKRNARRMMGFCEKLGVQLRPHMKTHKTLYEHTHTTHSHVVTVILLFLMRSVCIYVLVSALTSWQVDHGGASWFPHLQRPVSMPTMDSMTSSMLTLCPLIRFSQHTHTEKTKSIWICVWLCVCVFVHRWSAVQRCQRGSISSRYYWIILRLWSGSSRGHWETAGCGTSGWNWTVATGEVNRLGEQAKAHVCLLRCRTQALCWSFAVAGVLHSDPEALRLAQAIAEAEGVELTGVYAHCGNTYNCRGVEQIQAVAQETTSLTLQFMEKYDITFKDKWRPIMSHVTSHNG